MALKSFVAENAVLEIIPWDDKCRIASEAK
jgi:hypothetical protein